ncbi:MAG: hypothetical protein K0S07_639 [Chlamydiales bacterium]|nr:hypothetical protein [Chlamydiales bacterium]
MTPATYLDIVQKTLIEKWQCYEQVLKTYPTDLTAGIAMLTQIARAAITPDLSKSPSPVLSEAPSLEKEPSRAAAQKIQAYVKAHSSTFRNVCQAGIPFSLLEQSAAEAALKKTLADQGSFLFHLIMGESSSWKDEAELKELVGTSLPHMQAEAIGEACFALKGPYLKEGDLRAGFYLLWLIKEAAGCSYAIPQKSSFTAHTVKQALSDALTNLSAPIDPLRFIEILSYRSCRLGQPLYVACLGQKGCFHFIQFALQHLQTTSSIDQWPGKAGIISNLLENLTADGRATMAKALALSSDSKTAEIGDHLGKALEATSLNEALPHFYALKERLPNFNEAYVATIFGQVFKEFCCDRSIHKTDPDFVRRLHFDSPEVFVHGSLMIGVYKSHMSYKEVRIPPHLLAYEMHTEKLMWGFPINPPASYRLGRVGDLVSLHFSGEKTVRLIDPKEGKLHSTLEMAKAFVDKENCFHLASERYAYQVANQGRDCLLSGGEIVNGQWNLSFEAKTPKGRFHPLSTHCGFLNHFENQLTLFGPSGEHIILENCLAVEARGDKLYMIEKDLSHADRSLLTVRTFKEGGELISAIEKSISLAVPIAFFGQLCQNEQWILLSARSSNRSPIFVDLQREEAVYSEHRLPSNAKYMIDAASGTFWSWDESSKEIWKVSPSHISLMGQLESGRGTTLLHVDESNHLYFVDNPF